MKGLRKIGKWKIKRNLERKKQKREKFAEYQKVEKLMEFGNAESGNVKNLQKLESGMFYEMKITFKITKPAYNSCLRQWL